ncbi:MAG TPA: hypothetical protein VFF67_05930 [Thermoplasmata archaeon]|nr:hypothetical protein [Thermoplasmata archaeon]
MNTSVTGVFFANNTSFAAPGAGRQYCVVGPSTYYYYQYDYCYPQAQNPSVVRLANGAIGVGYSVYTNRSTTACTAEASQTNARVAFSVSATNGSTFAAPVDIGNGTCRFLQAIEPSFAVAPDGTLYAAFIEENASSQVYGNGSTLPGDFANRSTDALAFVVSRSNGSSFSAPVPLDASGNLARPIVAAFGRSVYVLYENLTNTTTPIPSAVNPSPTPIALRLLASADEGATWSGPYTLPGLNRSQGYTAFAGSMAVEPTGSVVVAYATNRSCVLDYVSYCYRYGEQIVVAASTTNGSTWGVPTVVGAGVGEARCFDYVNTTSACPRYLFEWAPETTVAFDPAVGRLVVAWAGTFDRHASNVFENYLTTGVYVAIASAPTGPWTVTASHLQPDPSSLDDYYTPALGVVAGSVYLTYTWKNATTYCYSYCDYLDGTITQWTQWSPNGRNWSASILLGLAKVYGYPVATPETWPGYLASVGATAAGRPVIAYALNQPATSTSWYSSSLGKYLYNTSYATVLALAHPYVGRTVTLNLTETGLPGNASWTVAVDGNNFTASTPTILVTDVPPASGVLLHQFPFPAAYRTISTSSTSTPQFATYTVNATVLVAYTVQYGFALSFEPTTISYVSVGVDVAGYYYSDYESTSLYNGVTYHSDYAYPSFPWYLPLGARVTFAPSSTPPIAYWNGTGPGAFSGLGGWANVTIDAPINETGWGGAYGRSSVTFQSLGLPPSSNYTFGFRGTNHTAPGNASVVVANVTTGAYPIGPAQATALRPGWEYFGRASVGDTVVVPVEPLVNFSYVLVDVGAPAGPARFHAVGLTAGTVWRLGFNGTTYSSATPWINLTTRPGTFDIAPQPVVAANGSAGYAPFDLGPSINVTTGSTYNLSFTAAYRVEATAGVGGSVSNGSPGWVASGTNRSFTETPNSGYTFTGWEGTGVGSYSGPRPTASVVVGGPVTEVAGFAPLASDRFNVTFLESGIPSGTLWSVDVSGAGYASDRPTITVPSLLSCSAGTAGRYSLSVPDAFANGTGETRFSAISYPTEFCTDGGTVVGVAFEERFRVGVTSTDGGAASVSAGGLVGPGPVWVPNGSPVELVAQAAAGFRFVEWEGSGTGAYSGTSAFENFTPAASVDELAVFGRSAGASTPTFTVAFTLAAEILPGTTWSIDFASREFSSSTPELNVSGLPSGTYTLTVLPAYGPDGQTEYMPSGGSVQISVTENLSWSVAYAASFWVAVAATPGGFAGPGSGWVPAGAGIALNATAAPGYTFDGWVGSGPGRNYSGPDANPTFRATGPVSELAVFTPAIASTLRPSAAPAVAPWIWAAVGGTGLAIGLGAGTWLIRRRPPGASAVRPAEPEPDATEPPWQEVVAPGTNGSVEDLPPEEP